MNRSINQNESSPTYTTQSINQSIRWIPLNQWINQSINAIQWLTASHSNRLLISFAFSLLNRAISVLSSPNLSCNSLIITPSPTWINRAVFIRASRRLMELTATPVISGRGKDFSVWARSSSGMRSENALLAASGLTEALLCTTGDFAESVEANNVRTRSVGGENSRSVGLSFTLAAFFVLTEGVDMMTGKLSWNKLTLATLRVSSSLSSASGSNFGRYSFLSIKQSIHQKTVKSINQWIDRSMDRRN